MLSKLVDNVNKSFHTLTNESTIKTNNYILRLTHSRMWLNNFKLLKQLSIDILTSYYIKIKMNYDL